MDIVTQRFISFLIGMVFIGGFLTIIEECAESRSTKLEPESIEIMIDKSGKTDTIYHYNFFSE